MAELLVAMTVVSVLVLILTQFYMAMNDGLATLNAQSALQLQLTQGQRRLLGDIREAISVQATGPITITAPGTLNFTCDSESIVDARATTLCLTLPSVTAQHSPIFGQTDRVVYDLDTATGILTRYVDANAASSRTDAAAPITHHLAKAANGIAFGSGIGAGGAYVSCKMLGNRRERGRLYPFTLEFWGRLRNG